MNVRVDSSDSSFFTHFLTEGILNQLARGKDIADALQRLDSLTHEDTQVAVAKDLEVTEKNLAVTRQVEEGTQSLLSYLCTSINNFSAHAENSRG